jgi:hypothetical protein
MYSIQWKANNSDKNSLDLFRFYFEHESLQSPHFILYFSNTSYTRSNLTG